ncbi:MAG TPA: Sec-independent protein translocase protein TatB [Halothiobacillus sp.]|nr:Sec-independent protein translocase protein TatB [Halothiobacillus sp.]
MFGFSIWEIFLILVIALIVVGPERLPGLARTIGSWVYKVKKFVANAKAELDSEFNLSDMKNLLTAQESELSKLRALVEETRQEVTESGRHMLGAMDEAEASLRAAAQSEQKKLSAIDSDTAPAAVEKIDQTADNNASSPEPAPTPELTPRALSFDDEIRALEQSAGQPFKRPFEAPSEASPEAPLAATPPSATPSSDSKTP